MVTVTAGNISTAFQKYLADHGCILVLYLVPWMEIWHLIDLDQPVSLRLLSFNLRYDSQPDNISVDETLKSLPDPLLQRTVFYNNTAERPWSARRIGPYNEVIFNRVDLAGMFRNHGNKHWGHMPVYRFPRRYLRCNTHIQ